MIYGSVCSGVEAATLAWEPLGWKPVFFSEIAPFPSAVLSQRWPDVPNLGDLTKIKGETIGKIDLLTGGTPCQAFSVAGLRKGLEDQRGNLALEFVRLAFESNSRWIVWENVPGVLSSNKGRDFACFLSALCGWEIPVPEKGWKKSGIITPAPEGFGLAWRIVDAQFVRVDGYPGAIPQRRRRLFVVGYTGNWARSAAVLFDHGSLSGDPSPLREARKGVARTITASTGGASAKEQQYTFIGADGTPLNALGTWWDDKESYCIVGNSINRTPFSGSKGKGYKSELCYTLTTADRHAVAQCCCLSQNDYGQDCGCNIAGTLRRSVHHAVADRSSVRRMTPLECERLMGFPDYHTRITWKGKPPEECPDGHRYMACGNSQCVNVMRWIGQRIDIVNRMR